jgi:hypothetical protein
VFFASFQTALFRTKLPIATNNDEENIRKVWKRMPNSRKSALAGVSVQEDWKETKGNLLFVGHKGIGREFQGVRRACCFMVVGAQRDWKETKRRSSEFMAGISEAAKGRAYCFMAGVARVLQDFKRNSISLLLRRNIYIYIYGYLDIVLLQKSYLVLKPHFRNKL